jgi:hypothetical protein
MSTNRDLIGKALKYLALSLPLLFIGPAVIYNAFVNKNNIWHWLVLAVGIAICGTAVYLAFKGLNTMMKALFNEKE